MKVFSVYVKNNLIDDAKFVDASFSFKALIFGALWCFFHRLWLVGAAFIILNACTTFGVNNYLIDSRVGTLIGVIFNFYLGFTAYQWRELFLVRRGYLLRASIVADNCIKAQMKFFKCIDKEAKL